MVGSLVLGCSPFHAQTSTCPVAMVGLSGPTTSPMRAKSSRLASFVAQDRPIGPVTCPSSTLAMAGIAGQKDEKDGEEALESVPCSDLSLCQKAHACQAKAVAGIEVASLRTTKDHASSDGQVAKTSDRLAAIAASLAVKSLIAKLGESRGPGRRTSAAPTALQALAVVSALVVAVV